MALFAGCKDCGKTAPAADAGTADMASDMGVSSNVTDAVLAADSAPAADLSQADK